jgi:hypothetical protein
MAYARSLPNSLLSRPSSGVRRKPFSGNPITPDPDQQHQATSTALASISQLNFRFARFGADLMPDLIAASLSMSGSGIVFGW